MNSIDNYLSSYTGIICRLSEQKEATALLSETAEFRRFFESMKTGFSGCWEPVEESLGFLEAVLQKENCPHVLILACVQHLISVSELCIGSYFHGSMVIRDENRCRYLVLPNEQNERGIVTVAVVLESDELLDKYMGRMLKLAEAGHKVLVVLLKSDDDRASDIPFKIIRSPKCLNLQALFDLAYYSSKTEFFLFTHNGLPDTAFIDPVLREMREDSSIACLLLENAESYGETRVPAFLECGMSGIYRRSAVAKIGSLDCLFSGESYICEDYLTRARALGYTALSVPCPYEICLENSVEDGISRDDEAMMRKHGKDQKNIVDKLFAREFFQHFSSALSGLRNIVLVHNGDDRYADMLSLMIKREAEKEAVIEVKDMTQTQEYTDALIFCFPICYCRDFDSILCAAAENTNAKLIAFFDTNYLSASSLESILSDRALFLSDTITIWHRKKLRDKITDKGYDVVFSRIAAEVNESIENNLRESFPDAYDMILKNIQSGYYTYVCERTEPDKNR